MSVLNHLVLFRYRWILSVFLIISILLLSDCYLFRRLTSLQKGWCSVRCLAFNWHSVEYFCNKCDRGWRLQFIIMTLIINTELSEGMTHLGHVTICLNQELCWWSDCVESYWRDLGQHKTKKKGKRQKTMQRCETRKKTHEYSRIRVSIVPWNENRGDWGAGGRGGWKRGMLRG